MKQYPKRLIEVDLPIKRISRRVRGERNLLSALHQWWARRPLGACRSVMCAALWPDPVDAGCPPEFRKAAERLLRDFARRATSDRNISRICESESWSRYRALNDESGSMEPVLLRQILLDFIADFASAEAATNSTFSKTANALTDAAHHSLSGINTSRPLVFDPFAGGGSIPFEALRCGADVFASDLNPIPVLINKMIVELIPVEGNWLAERIGPLSREALRRTEQVCKQLYPNDPISYLWARTITCEGPSCGARVPVLRSLWIDKSRSTSFAYALQDGETANTIQVLIHKNPESGTVKNGTSRRGSVTCPLCGFTTARRNVEAQAKNSGLQQMLMAVVQASPNGRDYRSPNNSEYDSLKLASDVGKTQAVDDHLLTAPLPYLRSIFNVHLYGMTRWRDLFSDRQFVFMNELSKQLKEVIAEQAGINEKKRLALRVALAFVLDRVAAISCNVTRWRSDHGRMEGAFSMMALPMVWDWVEWNPFNTEIAQFGNIADSVAESIRRIAEVATRTGSADQHDATSLPLPDDSASLFFTDPPYYDYVPYANLSDFYYIWLKSQIGDSFLWLTENESPKSNEIVQLAERNPIYAHKTKEFFEDQILKALLEARRVTDPSSIGVIVFAHKSTVVWESLLGAVVNAGWVITASWPIDTELTTRFKAIGTASLNSSVHLVCRPRENRDGTVRTNDIGDWRDILRDLPLRIHEWMPRLAAEGVVGADAIFACLGPALEIFSKYSSVEKPNGDPVTLREYLEYVWAAVAKEALNMIFTGADATGFEEDARLSAMWLWTLFAGFTATGDGTLETTSEDAGDDESNGKSAKASGYILEYDAARKIAQGLGAHLEDLESLVHVKGDQATLLSVGERARYLFGYDESSTSSKKLKSKTQKSLFTEMDEIDGISTLTGLSSPEAGATTLDRVHQAMLLFGAGRGEAVRRFLVDDGAGNDERFWRLANALSALYPAGTDEKRWVDGILARKKGLGF